MIAAARLPALMLRSNGAVARGIRVPCPACSEKQGTPCHVDNSKSEVHDRRESLAYSLGYR